MADHLQGRPVQTDRANARVGCQRRHRYAHDNIPHVVDRGIGDHLFQIGLRKGCEGPVKCADHTECQDHLTCLNKGLWCHLPGKAHQPVGAEFQHHPCEDHTACGWCLHMGRRQPGVHRKGRNFHRKGKEHGNQRQHGRDPGKRRGINPGPHVKGATAQIQPDDRQQKRQRPQKRVEKEHQPGALPILVPPADDHEIHAHQRNLEKHVEQQPVQRHEGAERGGLQHQHQHHIGGGAFPDPRRIDCRQQEQQRGQQHQRQAQPVNAQPVGRADGRDPGDLFDLGKAARRYAARPDRQCYQENCPGCRDRDTMRDPCRPVRQRHKPEPREDRQKGCDGQKRHGFDPYR